MPLTEENLRQYEFALILPPGQRYPAIYRQLQGPGERRCGFSSDNLFAQAALISQSDMLGLMPERCFLCWRERGRWQGSTTLNYPKSALRLHCITTG
jgi:hypothetical protein